MRHNTLPIGFNDDHSRGQSYQTLAFTRVLQLLILSSLGLLVVACGKKPPPPVKVDPPPAVNPLPNLPATDDVHHINPDEDPSALPANQKS